MEEKRHEELKKELYQMNREFELVKQSVIWKVLRRLKRGVSFLRKVLLCLTGKQSWYVLFKSGNEKTAKKRIKRLKYSLYELGFVDRSLRDLEELASTTNNFYLERMAYWELALWYANQGNEEGANKCLRYLKLAMRGDKSKVSLRKEAIMKADCYKILKETDKGKKVIQRALRMEEHPDLFLAGASLEESPEERLKWINKLLNLYNLANISAVIDGEKSLYDRLKIEGYEIVAKTKDNLVEPKVSIIVPVFNAEDVIHTSIQSILKQSWSNIEVLIVDDCSTDNTVTIIEDYVKKDSRVKLFRTKKNGGAYVARNIALNNATGDFVTVNDADDWSHPDKIKVQVTHLIKNKSVIANTSQQARATEDLVFYRRNKPGYMFANMSSLMFRREKVLEAIGFWDEVRFGADGEFKRRLKLYFGDEKVVDLETGPLSFQRQTKGSLTGNSVFGYHGFFMGARKEYLDSYKNFHDNTNNLNYELSPSKRPFPVPEPMLPKRKVKVGENRHFDVVIASEFRLLGGTNMSNIEEIKAQKKFGMKTGLIQLNRYDFHSEEDINPKVRELVDGNEVEFVVYGENISCDVLIVRHPPVLQELQKYVPNVEAGKVKVIINQPPKREYSEEGRTLYNINQCVQNLEHYFGQTGVWYPIGPKIRETLLNQHSKQLKSINLSENYWVNIIDLSEWKRKEHFPSQSSVIKIGRHSRSQYVKWPSDPEELLEIYPESNDYEIHVLGGADVPKEIIGRLPTNWKVHEFGELHPKDFLSEIDVFVYYTHPDWVEAFGRVIFEAMAVGVPVIIDPSYEELFGNAAIYAKPKEVRQRIHEIMADDAYYIDQVKRAYDYVEKNFGYSKHQKRLQEHD
ncbi:glycosyltransferase [Bacillus alkalicola]|uniref:Glycosyltransferase n=2 Tax=Bacillales TaxID=1385 RepID=A0ABS6JZS6_9BACI|nr:glycosyltransferase [Bacillus alkalicola]